MNSKESSSNFWKKLIRNRWFKWIVGIILAGFAAVLLFMGSVYFGFWGKIPDAKEITSLKQAIASGVYDHNGKLIGKYFIYDRELVAYDQLPKHLVDALVATEDARFYEHDGVDSRSMLRVLFKSILMGDDSSGGGSTITMQLAKNLFGRPDHGLFSMPVNKYKEAIVAGRLEDIYAKNEILTLYLNTVSFSDNTYGIESAAKKFYNKEVTDLTLDESATLIGTLKANHSYNPRLFRERSQLRRDVVLTQMQKYGYITEAEAQNAMLKNIKLTYRSFQSDEGAAPYFREQIRQELDTLLKQYKKPDGSDYDVYKDGLRIYTTLDLDMQEIAEDAMMAHMTYIQNQYEKAYGNYTPWRKNKKIFQSAMRKLPVYQKLKKEGLSEKEIIAQLEKKHSVHVLEQMKDTVLEISTLDSLQYHLKQLNTGFLALEPNTGAVRAYIGGVNFKHFKYDHISQSKRQVGSTFKPFVYTAALQNGTQPCAYFPIEAVTYKDEEDWTPTNATKNEDDDEHTFYSMKYALSHSVNTIAVKVLKHTGVDKVIDQAHAMGIQSDLPQVSSIALGTAELSLKELASAYASFVNDSRPIKPYYITKIVDKRGKVIMEHTTEKEAPQAFSDDTRQTMIEYMKATVNEGTATRLRYTYGLQNDIAGKTGTTQDNRDAWFVGITPKLVTVTWVGNDNHQIGFNSTRIGQGANAALPMFGRFYKKLNQNATFNDITNAHFEDPSEEVVAALQCEDRYEETFVDRLFGNKSTIKLKGEDTEEAQKKEDEKKKKRKGFFSFLKKKKAQ
ncbi:penicillin-binding protein 1A [Pustulibacterium marinum]|uniref:Penicillin-binding protein 1A n=1 Tax=Pustulibacterium marinum TaxID=1224947 RepID=A0A1I7I1C3_9FLAO|nr:transglycosylase domain-containing protein [Pustulibacterium marinum]SFU66707.1 penicillin-binding protein 1A [Pustulibacterium marinum]